MATKNNNTLTYRVGQLEKTVEKVEVSMEKLLTNDMPHIQVELVAVKTRMNVLTAVNLAAIIVALIVDKLL